MINSAKSFTHKILSMKEKAVKAFARNLVQDFLCVLCKLYKQLLMNFTKMNCFLLSQANFGIVATKSVIKNEIGDCQEALKRSVSFNPTPKEGSKNIFKNYASLSKVNSGKMKTEILVSRIGIVGSHWRINDGCNVRYHHVKLAVPVTSTYAAAKNTSCKVIRKSGFRIPVF